MNDMINMTDILNIEIFGSSVGQLKEISSDTTNKQYMTNSTKNVIDFDEVKNKYIANCNPKGSSFLSSVDAIAEFERITFIEFKNGEIDKKTQRNICNKIRDSLLMFCDITGKNISYTRKNIDFMLVCNGDKNDIPIINRVIVNAEDFKFNIFKNIYFREINICTVELFEEFLLKYQSI